jgi:hypothetical protein
MGHLPFITLSRAFVLVGPFGWGAVACIVGLLAHFYAPKREVISTHPFEYFGFVVALFLFVRCARRYILPSTLCRTVYARLRLRNAASVYLYSIVLAFSSVVSMR